MIKAVIFDLDDTLISEKEYIRSGFRQVSKKIAKENNLNYLEFFNMDQFLKWYKTQSGTLLLEYKSSIQ